MQSTKTLVGKITMPLIYDFFGHHITAGDLVLVSNCTKNRIELCYVTDKVKKDNKKPYMILLRVRPGYSVSAYKFFYSEIPFQTDFTPTWYNAPNIIKYDFKNLDEKIKPLVDQCKAYSGNINLEDIITGKVSVTSI